MSVERLHTAGRPPLQQGRISACLRLGVSALAVAVAVAVSAGAEPALAQSLNVDGSDGLITDTIANRERMRTWDAAKIYGAGTVREHDRAFNEPDGIRSGNYMIYPTIGAQVTYDDNIFASDAFKKSDLRSDTTAGLLFRSDLPRHVLDFSLDGKIVNYLENTDQNYENYQAKVDGALHFDSAHTISAGLLSELVHEERDDPLAPTSAGEPVPVWHNRVAAGITRDAGRLYGTLSGAAEDFNYSNVKGTDGTTLDQDARDTSIYSAQLKMGYRFSPGYEFVGKIRGSVDDNHATGDLNRDATTFEAMAGLAFESDPLLRWRILGGYGTKDFERDQLAPINTSLLQADLQWLPTERLTIYGTVSRFLSEATNVDESGGVVQTRAQLRADYEIYHDLVLSGSLEYRNYDFKGIARADDIYAARIGLEYYYTKNWLFTFGYEHQIRDSSDDLLDMTRNRFMIGAKLRF